jgi:hypothetical protein
MQRLAGQLALVCALAMFAITGVWAQDTPCEGACAGAPGPELKADGVTPQGRDPLDSPEGTLFVHLIADPKEPHFYASALRTRADARGTSVTLASVGFGEQFGVWGQRQRRGGWQVGIQAGVLAQLNLDPATSYALINADYIVGIPFAWRRDRLSARVRVYHQSSHVGDELLLLNPGLERINLSFEELEAVGAYDVLDGHGRLYAGGGFLLKRHPAMKRGRLLWGLEWRGRSHSPAIARGLHFVTTPVVGVEVKAAGELQWKPSVRIIGGVELARARGQRGVHLLAEYYHGFFPYGQFYDQKVDHLGVGAHLEF